MAKTVTCGYCKRTGIPLDNDGSLSAHTIRTSNVSVCKGMETYLRLDAQGKVRDSHG